MKENVQREPTENCLTFLRMFIGLNERIVHESQFIWLLRATTDSVRSVDASIKSNIKIAYSLVGRKCMRNNRERK